MVLIDRVHPEIGTWPFDAIGVENTEPTAQLVEHLVGRRLHQEAARIHRSDDEVGRDPPFAQRPEQMAEIPGLEAGGGKGPLWRVVVAAGAFDGHDQVLDAAAVQDLAELGEGGGELNLVMLDERGWDQDVAVEIGEHVFGAGLGTVDGNDPEMFRPDLCTRG